MIFRIPPPTFTFACVFAQQHSQPPAVVLSSQNNLLCFLIWNCVLHLFLSATNPRFLALPSPAPNLFHHAYSAVRCGVYFHMMTCCVTAPQYYSPLCDNRIFHHITTNSHLFLLFLAHVFAPLSSSCSLALSLTLSLSPLSISAGDNPCCLRTGDRSCLSANHSNDLTSEMLRYLLSHSQWGATPPPNQTHSEYF